MGRKKGKNRITAVLLGLTIMLGLVLSQAGCIGIDQENKNTLELQEDGAITQVIVDDTEGNITGEELEAYINGEISAVSGGGDTVSLDTCRVGSGKVNITLLYSSVNAYAAFNNVVCFWGTVKEAYDAGYDFNRSFKAANGAQIPWYTLVSMTKDECRVLVLEEPVGVTLPGEVFIVSDGVTIADDGSVSVDENPDTQVPQEFQTTTLSPVFIIYKVAEKS